MLNQYSHVLPSMQKDVASKLDNLFEAQIFSFYDQHVVNASLPLFQFKRPISVAENWFAFAVFRNAIDV